MVPGFFGGGTAALGDPQQPFVDRVNHVWQVANDLTWITGRHSLKFGVDIRREAMSIAFINRPNGDLTFSGGLTGNAAADFLLGLPAQARATTQQAIQDGYGWLFAGYAQDEFRVTSQLTLNLGVRYELPTPFIDQNDAITGFRTGVQSQMFPAAPAGLVYPGDPACRAASCRPTRTTSRRASRWRGIPFGDGQTSVRSAFGVFYDALAGQGDFFQSGVLSPPFTPLIELNTPTPITLADPLAAVAGPPNPFPPALTIIGWGDEFKSPYAYHFNVGVQRQLLRAIGTEVAYVGSRGHNLPIFMEVNPGVYTPGQTTRGARVMPAFALVRPTFPVAQVVVRLAADQRPHAADARPQLPRQLHARQDHRSRVGPQHRRRGAAGAAGRAGRRGQHRARARVRERAGAVRCAPSLRASASATSCRGSTDRRPVVRHIAGGWQLNGIYQAQSGFPLTVNAGHGARHPLHDVAARRDLRSQRRPEDDRAVVQHVVLHAR